MRATRVERDFQLMHHGKVERVEPTKGRLMRLLDDLEMNANLPDKLIALLEGIVEMLPNELPETQEKST